MQLENNPILYADIINSLALDAKILYEDMHAICIQDTHSDIVYVASTSQESAIQMESYIPKDFSILVSHDTFTNKVLNEKRNLVYENKCYHCAYLSKEPFTLEIPEGYRIAYVTKEYMQDVIALYGKEMPTLANEDYMGLCMDGGMLGIFQKTILCGFICVHEGGYGSIGMLEVKEEYRHRGFGVLLEKAMINVQIERGRIPYGEIFIENSASLQLQKKVGISIGKDLTYWFYG